MVHVKAPDYLEIIFLGLSQALLSSTEISALIRSSTLPLYPEDRRSLKQMEQWRERARFSEQF
jgi:hypothetical protein